MPSNPREKSNELNKSKIHPKNRHRESYDFDALTATSPELKEYVKVNEHGTKSIHFFNPNAVKSLNKALLMHFYDITYWDIPKGYLCPPIPGRADYIHYVAELLYDSIPTSKYRKIPRGSNIQVLDVGIGANCVYPIVGQHEYGWSFIGSEIDAAAIQSARKIIKNNAGLSRNLVLRIQANPKNIFKGVLKKEDRMDVTLCNPPFFSSAEEVQKANKRKNSNLKKQASKAKLNFGGTHTELWCEGGEDAFVGQMIQESKAFAQSCFWFTTLISKETHLNKALKALRRTNVHQVEIINMAQGNKTSRVLAWTFLNTDQQKHWIKTRW